MGLIFSSCREEEVPDFKVWSKTEVFITGDVFCKNLIIEKNACLTIQYNGNLTILRSLINQGNYKNLGNLIIGKSLQCGNIIYDIE